MDWIAAILTITSCELLTRKLWYGWIVGLLNQAVWYYVSYSNGLYGMFALTIALTCMSVRALIRWRREAQA